MKPKRYVVIAAVALLVAAVVGGAIGIHSFAHQATASPAQAEVQAHDEAEDMTSQGADTDNIQQGDQNGADVEENDGQDTAPSGTPAITAEAAQRTAEAHLNAGTAAKVELDDENGKLVYSVDIGGTDVKVDAMTGAVIGTENAED